MNTIKLMLSGLLLFAALSGCASKPTINDKLLDAQIAAAARPTFSLTCPPQGCTLGNLSYTDSRDRSSIRMPTNGWDFAGTVVRETGGLALGMSPWLAVGRIGVEGLRNAGHNSTSASTTTSTNATTSTNTETARYDLTTTYTDSYNAVDSTHAPTVVTQPAPLVVGP